MYRSFPSFFGSALFLFQEKNILPSAFVVCIAYIQNIHTQLELVVYWWWVRDEPNTGSLYYFLYRITYERQKGAI